MTISLSFLHPCVDLSIFVLLSSPLCGFFQAGPQPTRSWGLHLTHGEHTALIVHNVSYALSLFLLSGSSSHSLLPLDGYDSEPRVDPYVPHFLHRTHVILSEWLS